MRNWIVCCRRQDSHLWSEAEKGKDEEMEATQRQRLG